MRLISYTTKSGEAAENRAKIEAVFAALADARPAELAYMVFETEAGEFFHVVEATEAGLAALQALPAFEAFSSTASERQAAPSQRRDVRLVGSYGVLVSN